MRYSIEKHDALNFIKFKNLGFYHGEHGSYVKVFFVIEAKGSKDEGTDDVTLKRENDRWIIWKVPI